MNERTESNPSSTQVQSSHIYAIFGSNAFIKTLTRENSVSRVVRWNVTEGKMKAISTCNGWEWIHVYLQAQGVYGTVQRH